MKLEEDALRRCRKKSNKERKEFGEASSSPAVGKSGEAGKGEIV